MPEPSPRPMEDASDEGVECSVCSEYGALRTVLVHKPGHEIDRLTPLNKSRLLFEDIPYLERMQSEHDALVDVMRQAGVHVLYLKDLLTDIVQIPEVTRTLLNTVCLAGWQPGIAHTIRDAYPPDEIADLLFAGLTATELQERTGKALSSTNPRDDFFILEPIPNAYFVRDPAAVIGDCVVSCKMHFGARVRESIMVREVFRRHPLLGGSQILHGDNTEEDRPYCIEGGDIIILNDKAIAVGCSQRTRSETVAVLATNLMRAGKIERVYEVNIPVARQYMHLDTVFTVVNEGVVVAYPDVMDSVVEIRRYDPLLMPTGEVIAYPTDEVRRFNRVLEDEFATPLVVVNTGDNNPRYAAREQGADATNVFALRPGTVVTYRRNVHTNEALRAIGLEVIEIEGSELVRGLGGPRCMTMPISRIASRAASEQAGQQC
jgi:arginine deiminase